MTIFGWIPEELDPPSHWDLRDLGWTLCRRPLAERPTCLHPLVVDVRAMNAEERLVLVEGQDAARRLILLGVEEGAQRASLLARGCGETLPGQTSLSELDARARRVAEMGAMLPRFRSAGPLILDLFHRDARLGPNWLALHPREFGLLWRLADEPGKRVTRRDLLRDVWRIHHEPETNSVEVHVSRLRSKLAGVGCEAVVETATEGGYLVVASPCGSGAAGLHAPALARSPFAPRHHFADS